MFLFLGSEEVGDIEGHYRKAPGQDSVVEESEQSIAPAPCLAHYCRQGGNAGEI